jgi:hypothetical protein
MLADAVDGKIRHNGTALNHAFELHNYKKVGLCQGQ